MARLYGKSKAAEHGSALQKIESSRAWLGSTEDQKQSSKLDSTEYQKQPGMARLYNGRTQQGA
ncbi:hypothetical protein [Stenotrophomonas sp. PFBMAA-4]|uniref:hypothetical protein n=1 Tax=Stenotrophomonas sp. PFBMAA-4 TaxID=3043301 RepID=UPI0024B4EE5C|nr:hypothetical protein [Stenotrophomonas sp. PFBMAA-4]MDI9275143.1 hypothetical protein [Stenotrophomonas sp. PFBMAA-4]